MRNKIKKLIIMVLLSMIIGNISLMKCIESKEPDDITLNNNVMKFTI